jgi:hypothetical protein
MSYKPGDILYRVETFYGMARLKQLELIEERKGSWLGTYTIYLDGYPHKYFIYCRPEDYYRTRAEAINDAKNKAVREFNTMYDQLVKMEGESC